VQRQRRPISARAGLSTMRGRAASAPIAPRRLRRGARSRAGQERARARPHRGRRPRLERRAIIDRSSPRQHERIESSGHAPRSAGSPRFRIDERLRLARSASRAIAPGVLGASIHTAMAARAGVRQELAHHQAPTSPRRSAREERGWSARSGTASAACPRSSAGRARAERYVERQRSASSRRGGGSSGRRAGGAGPDRPAGARREWRRGRPGGRISTAPSSRSARRRSAIGSRPAPRTESVLTRVPLSSVPIIPFTRSAPFEAPQAKLA
jgi:hypothetical protein